MNSLTDKEINRASDGIDKALSTATRSNRGEVAFRILSVVRNLNDHIAFKIWKDVRPDQKMDINKVASKFGNVRPYQFVARFDHFLRASVSHFTPSEEGAERLMIKYYRYLLQLKKAVYDRYGMIILRNVDMFLEDLDEQTKDYYQKVAAEIEKRLRIPPPKNFDNYYIDKIKPFFVNQEIYYEVALEPADEKPNKFNRITAFTKYDISTDYPSEARHIDFVAGVQFFRRLWRSWLWCGILSGCLPRGKLEFGSYGCFNRPCLRFRTFLLGCFLLRNLVFHLCQ